MSLAVVTGAARGIGRAVAERLVTRHSLLLVDMSQAVHETAAQLGAVAVQADITQPEGIAAIVAAVDGASEPPAMLVNNAGITRDALIHKMEEAVFRAVVRVNLGGTYALTEALAGRIVDGGSVVNLSSRAQLGNVGQFNYAVSKTGVIGCTRALALALAPRLRVNAVAPGFVESDMTRAMPARVRERVVSAVPLARAGQPEDIADAVAWLGSEAAGYLTGQVLYVCGGRSFG
ncbi:beta-ketoacyl-ACP reductase [Streptomyces viridiviolaceus]|uniref:SDR family oxidoreductase n=1 Tax=Streptomyces viridiviolaceus TaxID=68282 RepID=A0ABW2EAA3_9ACTN|nr:SDR family oxidoreductase [Streptomyces viridiviolaceus]GHB73756.1 beta-ketoacyl-ACP reductase [Streptomyces viridiviolaceus]